MIRLRDKKAAELQMKKIITIILVILVLVVLLIAVFGFGIPNLFKDLFPDFLGLDNQYIYADKCPVKIAQIINEEKIKFCLDDECKQLLDTKILIDDNEIEIDQKINDEIGQITRGVLILNREIREREGVSYSKVAQDLPDFYYILNLHNSYLYNDKVSICRNERVYEDIPENSVWIASVAYTKAHWWPSWRDMILVNSAESLVSTAETGISIEGNYLLVRTILGSTKIGERAENKLSIYQQYLDNPKVKGLTNSWILKDLNGAEIKQGKIYQIKQETK